MITPRYLGRTVTGSITADQLDVVPIAPNTTTVTYETSELAAVCPVTGQPDLYQATITYRAAGRSLESKSLKLYLTGFRDLGIFCEDLAARVAEDLSAALHTPVTVTLRQQVRGGLVLTATATTRDET